MNRKKLLIIGGIVLGVLLIIGIGALSARNDKPKTNPKGIKINPQTGTTGEYYKDSKTGDTLYRDPNQTPERVSREPSLLGAEAVYQLMSPEQFTSLRTKLSQWVQMKIEDPANPDKEAHVDVIYIDKNSVRKGENNNVFFNIETSPHKLTSQVRVEVYKQVVIYVYFDGQEKPFVFKKTPLQDND